MLARLRSRRPGHATVVAYLALFVALGGTGAYAANTVFSTDIVDGEVKNPDLGADAIGPAKVADRTLSGVEFKTESVGTLVVTGLTGSDVADNSLVGADIDESTLFNDNSLTGTDVQESSLLGVNADKVDGGDLCRTGGVLTVTENNSFSTHKVCDQGALKVEAICAAANNTATTVVSANLRLDTSVNNSFYGVRGGSASQDGDWDAADAVVALTSAGDESVADPGVASQLVSFYAGTPAGAQLSGTAGARATLNGDGSGTCDFVVGAIG